MMCEICKRGMADGVNLHRQNEKGVIGVWRCDDCNTLPIDPEIQAIIDSLINETREIKRIVEEFEKR